MNLRKIHSLLFVILLASFFACKKEDDPILDDPDSRLNTYLENSLQTLTEAPYGYKATLFTKAEKTFAFFMQFDKDGRVSMLSDFDGNSAVKLQSSTYRLKALQRPSVIFDTYNYISMLADPQGSVNGGTNGQGLFGDNDYSFLKFSGDSVGLIGNKNTSQLLLIKATEAEQKSYLEGGLGQSRQLLTTFMNSHKYPYILVDNKKIALAIDQSSRQVTLSWLEADGTTITNLSSPFFYTPEGIIAPFLELGKNYIEEIKWDNEKKTYILTVAGQQIQVQSNPTPVFPLVLQFGFKKTYSIIGTNNNTLPDGVNSTFNNLWKTVNTNFTSSGRTIRYIEFKLISENQATLTVYYSSGTTNYIADMSFTYTINQNLLKLTDPKRDFSNGNWTSRLAQLSVLEDYILKGPFVLDWVSSSSSKVTEPLGGLSPQSNAADFFYGYLK
ncbi:DUF4302 domain-containing protein [Sphingobacterium yanglingense]|uniref:Uncharacterized protein DUF4302 n=1 Tax=Sphingobacterium yanglingense TaxID=1437280 RepID=A0A4R6WH35_9SPHI|nr:DUF4302 domain-containing protein [Sphingobacterium yanglingense]TDQ77806.1 uncharacterized protein DUF4302 [Sphingobacterium yanglingense]